MYLSLSLYLYLSIPPFSLLSTKEPSVLRFDLILFGKWKQLLTNAPFMYSKTLDFAPHKAVLLQSGDNCNKGAYFHPDLDEA